MARATAGNNRDLLLFERIRATENDLVLRVESKRRVCESQRMEGSDNQMVRVREEVFGCVALVHLSMHIFWGFSFVCGAMMIVGLIARGCIRPQREKTNKMG